MWRLARHHTFLAAANADYRSHHGNPKNGDGKQPDRRLQIMARAHQWNIVMAVG